MIFSSPLFLFTFLPLVLACYYLLSGHSTSVRNWLLLGASLFFYAHGERLFVAVLLASIVFNYGAGILIAKVSTPSAKRYAAGGAICGNIGLLAVFKYTNFAVDSINSVLAAIGIASLSVGVVRFPAGISFFTFHALTYIIDIYRGQVKAQRRFRDLALYLSFFPRLIAGPIVRYSDTAEEFGERRVCAEDFAYGVSRLVVGLGKKVLLANTIGHTVDEILALPTTELSTPLAWLAMVGYTLQLYFDFSGYSDMAIGLARMFGFRIKENFQYPYISRTITEFWRRWHISLSSWFRDYLYIPLGGNRGTAAATYRNLVIVFFLCGLWHGASWNFVIWGLFHGAFLVFERIGRVRLTIERLGPLAHIYAMLVVLIGWVIFRTNDMSQAINVVRALFGLQSVISYDPPLGYYLDSELVVALACGVVGSTPIAPWSLRQKPGVFAKRWSYVVLTILFLTSLVRISADSNSPFIYYQF